MNGSGAGKRNRGKKLNAYEKCVAEFLALIVRAALPQVIVSTSQIVALIRRQILKAIPLFTEVFFVLRRKILPALIVAPDVFPFLGTQTAPVVAAISSPSGNGRQQN